MASRYPKGMIEWVQQHYLEYDLPELTRKINEMFGTSMNAKAVSSMKKRYKLSGAPRAKIYTDTFPEEICRFIEANYIGTGHKEMAEMLWQQFGREYTPQQIKSFYANRKLNSGLTGHFVKGQESHNKGQKMSREQYEKCKATMFQSGNRPHNTLPVGSIVPTTDGYYKEKIAEPDVWEFCHLKAWREANGEIPEGCLVSFKDGNKENWDISNLILLTKEEHAYLNASHMRSECPEITVAAANLAKLTMKVRKIKKERKQNGSVL